MPVQYMRSAVYRLYRLGEGGGGDRGGGIQEEGIHRLNSGTGKTAPTGTSISLSLVIRSSVGIPKRMLQLVNQRKSKRCTGWSSLFPHPPSASVS
jgi:hypothetical protein